MSEPRPVRRWPAVSVVIPVYRSAVILPELVRRLEAALAALSERFEVILINDNSPDDSWRVIEELAAERGWLRGLCMMRNYGQHNAVLLGIREARYSVVVTLDDDLQHPPEEIGKLLAKLDEGHDVVYGTPEREQHGLLRDLASTMTKIALQTAMGAGIARKVSAFRAFRCELRDAFEGYRSPFVSIDVLLTWATTRFAAVKVRHDRRWEGGSNYNFGKLTSHALNMMTGFSVKPLQFASLVGFFFTLFGTGSLAVVLGRYLIHGRTVAGFTFIASIVTILSGAQLFALGIIGEYLARMHSRSMERPVYSIRERTAASGDR